MSCHHPINHVFDRYRYPPPPVPATARGTCRIIQKLDIIHFDWVYFLVSETCKDITCETNEVCKMAEKEGPLCRESKSQCCISPIGIISPVINTSVADLKVQFIVRDNFLI